MIAPAPLILSLCDYSGSWSAPYVEAGYRVVRVDIGHPTGLAFSDDGSWLLGSDVTTLVWPERPYAVLAAPPCTCFCRPGARWWKRQDADGSTARDIAVFRACLAICQQASGWWALENPPGRHRKLIPELGKPAWQFQPYEFGHPWGKQTYIWGTAQKPPVVAPVQPEPTRRTPNGRSQGRIAFIRVRGSVSEKRRQRALRRRSLRQTSNETRTPASIEGRHERVPVLLARASEAARAVQAAVPGVGSWVDEQRDG